MGMTAVIEKINPAKATRILNKNVCNRKLRPGVVERYTLDMKSNNWTECPDPISFYEDGELADGQHRLYAIIESDTVQTFIIVRDLPRAAGLNINVGLIRTLVDNARISGVNTDLSNRLIAVARAVATGKRNASSNFPTSNALKLAYIDTYGEACRWAISNGPTGKRYSHSLVLAAVARAWMHESDKARLVRFGEVVSTGFMEDDKDSAAVAFRNYLISTSATGFSHNDVWLDGFYKAQNAIKYFMRRRKLTIIKSVKEEVYPLPKAATAKKAA